MMPLLALVLIGSLTGCRAFRQFGSYIDQPVLVDSQPQLSNPLSVPMIDRWQIMDQVSDELDNYFRPSREQRISILDGVMSEGWVETHPTIGSTIFEPWRRDSTPGFEKAHASLQTVRRFAKVRVIPSGTDYLIDVKVFKELEDLPQPLGANIGGKLLRYDSALDIDQTPADPATDSDGWIPMGRDYSLEQKILGNIQARVNQCTGPIK